MSLPPRYRLAVVASLLALSSPASLRGQGPPSQGRSPSTAEPRAGVTSDPRGKQLREQLLQSGQSPEQIRARLRSAGFPSNLLDQYMTADTLAPAPGALMMEALNSLGLARLGAEDSLAFSGDVLAWRLRQDSLRLDSIIREDSLARRGAPLRLFGLETFRQPSTQFMPVMSGPVDASYRLGPGDGLGLILTGEVEAAYQLDVTREGFLIIPEVGQVYVNNLTLGQLREMLYDRLARVYSGISRRPTARTRFDVTVTRLRAIVVRVVGEVARPGSYQVAATGGPLSALYQAGGPTERANFRAVQVLRGTEVVDTVDLYDFLLRGATPADVRMSGGDVVFVPVRGPRVKIAGAVIRPGIYEVTASESIRDLIRIAGGLTPEASAVSATIDRVLPIEQREGPGRGRTVLTVDLRAALDPAGRPIPLAAGDSVTVFSIRGARTLAATVEGSVWQPGTYRLEPGMRLSDLINVAGGLRPETYGGRAQIIRSRPDSTRFLIGVPLDGNGSGERDPVLQESDRVSIYAQTDFRPQRYIAVWGSVGKPGLVAYADSITLRDAVLLAGGITEDAYLGRAEVARLEMSGNASGDSLAVVMAVPLDSSFVTDRTGRVARQVGTPQAPDVYLAPYDNVYIRRQPGWEEPRNVVITGEVTFPGRYTITSKNFRLTDLVARAGGLTDQAYTNGVRFFRREGDVRPPGAVPADTSRRTPSALMNRIGIDLPRVMREAGHKDNLLLSAGDSVHVPRFLPTVAVEGAVNAPASVTYVPGAGMDYYINAAGGYARIADKKGTFVQQPNGLIRKGGKPEPGAVVVVPRREAPPPDTGVSNALSIITAASQLVGALTAIIVVIVTR